MNPVDAIRLMCRHYPGGVEALAVMCGKSPDTLRHEIGGKDSRYKLGVADADTISAACIAINSPHCRAFVNAIAANCGEFVRLNVVDGSAGGDLRADSASVVKEASDLLTDITLSLSDGVISDNEFRKNSQDIAEAIEALQRTQRDLDAAYQRTNKLRAV